MYLLGNSSCLCVFKLRFTLLSPRNVLSPRTCSSGFTQHATLLMMARIKDFLKIAFVDTFVCNITRFTCVI